MLVSTIPNCSHASISPAAALNQEKGKQQVITKQQQLKVIQRLVGPPLFAAFLALSPIINPPDTAALIRIKSGKAAVFLYGKSVSYGQAIETQRGASLFGRACIGCHDAGGNILQPGATLFLKDLQRNGIDTEEEIYRITYYGKGRMPGFGEMCTPRGQCTFGARLKEDEIKVLADFVKSQAEQGWPNIGFSGD